MEVFSTKYLSGTVHVGDRTPQCGKGANGLGKRAFGGLLGKHENRGHMRAGVCSLRIYSLGGDVGTRKPDS